MMFPLMPRAFVRRSKLFVVFSVVVAITACGGGSGSGSSSSSVASSSISSSSSSSSVVSSSSISSSSSVSSASSSSSSSSSVPADTSPEPFTYAPVNGVALGAVVVSDAVTISGINVSVPVSVTGGEYAIDGGEFTSAAGNINAEQTLAVRATASDEAGVSVTVTVQAGEGSASFVVTTEHDLTPDAITFDAVSDAEPGEQVASAAATVTGISAPVAISVAGGEYAIDNGEFTSEPGEVTEGQIVAVRGVASDVLGESVNVELRLGEATDSHAAVFSITTVTDTTPPAAAITFPPPMAASEPTTLLVRGTTEDDYSAVTSVTVTVSNAGGSVTDYAVETTDDFANWTVNVTLGPGENTIAVLAEDDQGNVVSELDAQTVTVHQQASSEAFPDNETPFGDPKGLVVDAANNRYLVAAYDVFAVDMTTGERTIVVTTTALGGRGAVGLLVDEVREKIVIGGTFHPRSPLAVLTVNFDGSDPQVLSSATVPHSDQPEMNDAMTGFALDPDDHDIAYAVALETNNLVRLDLITGERTLVSDNAMPNSGPGFDEPFGVLMDSVSTRVFVASLMNGTLFSVDLETGFRTVLKHGHGDGLFYPMSLVWGSDGNTLLLAEYTQGLSVFDLETNTRTILQDLGRSTDSWVSRPPGAAYVLWLVRDDEALYAVDIQSGTLVTVSKSDDGW